MSGCIWVSTGYEVCRWGRHDAFRRCSSASRVQSYSASCSISGRRPSPRIKNAALFVVRLSGGVLPRMYIALWRRLARVWTPGLRLELEAELRLVRDLVDLSKASFGSVGALMLPPRGFAKSSSISGGPSSESVELSSSSNASWMYLCALTPPIVFLLSESILFLLSAESTFSSRICRSAWVSCASRECTSVPSLLLMRLSSWTFCSKRSFSVCNSNIWSFSSANVISASFISSEAPSSSSIFACSSRCLFFQLIWAFVNSLTAFSFSSCASFSNSSKTLTRLISSSCDSFNNVSRFSTRLFFSSTDFFNNDSSSSIRLPFWLLLFSRSFICRVNPSLISFSSCSIFSISSFLFISSSL